jgi:hypothetical protein
VSARSARTAGAARQDADPGDRAAGTDTRPVASVA